MQLTMKHSDTQENFSTGARRDTHAGKLRYDLISPLALTRLAEIYTKGAAHYGDRNWEKGMPFSRVMASLQRHLHAFNLGDCDEDHLAQMVWNGITLLHYQEAIRRGILPDELNDLPHYESRVAMVAPSQSAVNETPAITKAVNRSQQIQEDTLTKIGCPPRTASQIVGGTSNCRNYSAAKWVYIAGPMRGYEKSNFPMFDQARNRFGECLFNVISPADIDRFTNPTGADDTNQDVSDQTRFILRDFWALFFIKKTGGSDSGIVLLPGWEKSTGAAGEFFLARWLGLKCYRANGLGYPIEDALHDFALAHAVAKVEANSNSKVFRHKGSGLRYRLNGNVVELQMNYNNGLWERSNDYDDPKDFQQSIAEGVLILEGK